MLVERSFARANCELNVIADLDSFPTLVSVAASGLARTVLPWSALPEGFAEQYSVRQLVGEEVFRPVSLCWPTSMPRTAATLAVQGTLIELIEDLVHAGKWVGARQRLPAASKTASKGPGRTATS
jgi:LysR family nitrogen assimilation transcriptional regulator